MHCSGPFSDGIYPVVYGDGFVHHARAQHATTSASAAECTLLALCKSPPSQIEMTVS
jgi:hypothetical protein